MNFSRQKMVMPFLYTQFSTFIASDLQFSKALARVNYLIGFLLIYFKRFRLVKVGVGKKVDHDYIMVVNQLYEDNF